MDFKFIEAERTPLRGFLPAAVADCRHPPALCIFAGRVRASSQRLITEHQVHPPCAFSALCIFLQSRKHEVVHCPEYTATLAAVIKRHCATLLTHIFKFSARNTLVRTARMALEKENSRSSRWRCRKKWANAALPLPFHAKNHAR